MKRSTRVSTKTTPSHNFVTPEVKRHILESGCHPQIKEKLLSFFADPLAPEFAEDRKAIRGMLMQTERGQKMIKEALEYKESNDVKES